MRKIEERMVQAIRDRKNFTLSNTKVEWNGDACEVSLFGNLIAVITDTDVTLLAKQVIGFEEYASATTRSRMNAILYGLGIRFCIVQKDWQWYVMPVGHSDKMYPVKDWKLGFFR